MPPKRVGSNIANRHVLLVQCKVQDVGVLDHALLMHTFRYIDITMLYTLQLSTKNLMAICTIAGFNMALSSCELRRNVAVLPVLGNRKEWVDFNLIYLLETPIRQIMPSFFKCNQCLIGTDVMIGNGLTT
jgi:hypothetical protein